MSVDDPMLFIKSTKSLFSKNGVLIKKLHCPLNKSWDSLQLMPNSADRKCSECENTVVDTTHLDEEHLSQLCKEDKDICLKVSSRQSNIIFFED